MQILQLILAVALIVVVLLQSRGTGLSGVFGGSGGGVYRSKRGAEKWLFYITILLSISLVVLTLVNVAQF